MTFNNPGEIRYPEFRYSSAGLRLFQYCSSIVRVTVVSTPNPKLQHGTPAWQEPQDSEEDGCRLSCHLTEGLPITCNEKK